jgi:hypothetical protein
MKLVAGSLEPLAAYPAMEIRDVPTSPEEDAVQTAKPEMMQKPSDKLARPNDIGSLAFKFNATPAAIPIVIMAPSKETSTTKSTHIRWSHRLHRLQKPLPPTVPKQERWWWKSRYRHCGLQHIQSADIYLPRKQQLLEVQRSLLNIQTRLFCDLAGLCIRPMTVD